MLDEDATLISMFFFCVLVVKEDKKKSTFYFSGEDERRYVNYTSGGILELWSLYLMLAIVNVLSSFIDFDLLNFLGRVDVAGAHITALVTKREMDFRNLCKLFSFQQ